VFRADVGVAGLPTCRSRDDRSRVDPVTNINFKVINHIDGRPAVKQLTARDLTDLTVHECYEGPCTVEIRPAATAPLYRLPVRTFLEGYYWRCDFTLVGGTILHDYLEGQPTSLPSPAGVSHPGGRRSRTCIFFWHQTTRAQTGEELRTHHYRITIAGGLGEIGREAFEDFRIEPVGTNTVLIGDLD